MKGTKFIADMNNCAKDTEFVFDGTESEST